MKNLETSLGYTFKDATLLEAALTHPSLSRGKGAGAAYERLEFLGDRVLGLVMAQWLYRLFPHATEGELAKRHAALVSAATLINVGEAAGITQSLRLASGGATQRERQNIAALSDVVESVIGAMYLDGGLDPARRFIEKYWEDVIHIEATPIDPKSTLQEWAQGKGLPLPIYSVVERAGPAHAPVFKIKAAVQGFAPVVCEGNSKREAEKAAAEALLAIIDDKI